VAARVTLAPRVIADLKTILSRIAMVSPAAAALVDGRLRRALSFLPEFPEIGGPGRVAGPRELVAPKTSLIVAYRFKDDVVHILAVRHARRRWPKRL
jgi:toxin ParE1/3/4